MPAILRKLPFYDQFSAVHVRGRPCRHLSLPDPRLGEPRSERSASSRSADTPFSGCSRYWVYGQFSYPFATTPRLRRLARRAFQGVQPGSTHTRPTDSSTCRKCLDPSQQTRRTRPLCHSAPFLLECTGASVFVAMPISVPIAIARRPCRTAGATSDLPRLLPMSSFSAHTPQVLALWINPIRAGEPLCIFDTSCLLAASLLRVGCPFFLFSDFLQ